MTRARPRVLTRASTLLLGLLGFVAGEPVSGQDVERIRDVKLDADDDRVPDRLGERVVLEGVLTTDPYPTGSREVRAYLQDASGGIRLTTEDRAMLGGWERGDRVRVAGVVGQYRAMDVLELESAQRLGPGVLPAPRVVTVAELAGERWAGELVRVTARLSVAYDLELVDETGRVLFYVREKFFSDPSFTTELVANRAVEVVGIAEQYDTRPPLTGGYRLLPRDRADIVFEEEPNWGVVLGLGMLVLVALVVLSGWAWVTHERSVTAEALLLERGALVERQRRFLADAGHEIRTPLTVLRGDLEVALLKPRSADEYASIIGRAVGDLRAVSGLAEDLITLARTDVGEGSEAHTSVDAGALVTDVAGAFSAAAEGAGVRLDVELEPSLTLHADHAALKRALGNLVDNALKYAAGGGSVLVTTRSAEEDRVEIAVSDRGPGIGTEERTRLFDRFYRGSAAREIRGSGLGLSIVAAIMERHGGVVELRRRAGGGAVFVLRMPRGGRVGEPTAAVEVTQHVPAADASAAGPAPAMGRPAGNLSP